MNLFFTAVAINYFKLGWLMQHKFIIQAWRIESILSFFKKSFINNGNRLLLKAFF